MQVGARATLVILTACMGCQAAAFTCEQASDCVDGQLNGFCEADGYCSFADDECPSGRRYGSQGPSDIASTCVPTSSAGSSGSTTTSTTGSGTTTSSTTLTSTTSTTTTTDTTSTTTSSASSGGCFVTVIDLTVAAGQVPEAVTDFPLLVDVTDAALQGATVETAGLVFSDPADGTPLPFDVETLDATAGRLLAWVSVPSLAPQSGGAVRLSIGQGDAPSVDASEVWARADYLGVWHLEDLSDGAVDAAELQPAATVGNGIAVAPGRIGNGALFSGQPDPISIPTAFVGSLSSFTVSLWLRVDDLSALRGSVFRRLNGTSLYPRVYFDNGGTLVLQGRFGMSPDSTSFGAGGVLQEGAEVHATFTYDSVSGEGAIFVDAVEINSGTLGPGDPGPGVNELELGYDPDIDAALGGFIDEFRVSPMVRSDAWIQMSFLNQQPSSQFVVASPPTLEPCPSGG